jgi:hypothetical protein
VDGGSSSTICAQVISANDATARRIAKLCCKHAKWNVRITNVAGMLTYRGCRALSAAPSKRQKPMDGRYKRRDF